MADDPAAARGAARLFRISSEGLSRAALAAGAETPQFGSDSLPGLAVARFGYSW